MPDGSPVAARWATACPDWKERIMAGRSLVPDLPLFDAAADKALRIFKRLRLPDVVGNPTYGEACAPWVFDLVRAIFGSLDPETQLRAIREFFVLVPKGNGKTAIASAITITWSILNERPSAEGMFIAPRIKVAELAFEQAAGIIRLDPELTKLFHIRAHLRRIEHLKTGAFVQIKAADTEIVTGSKATFILIDETHEFAGRHKAAAVFLELRGSLGKRPDGFLLQITTQSKEAPAGVFRDELRRARKVRDGEVMLPILPVLYELPPEVSRNNGWQDPVLWPLVNPSLGRGLDSAYLADQIVAADGDPEKLRLLASQHFNVEITVGGGSDRWSGVDHWDAAAMPEGRLTLDALIDACDVAVAGIDWGGADDLAALAVIGRHRETKAWLHWVRAWARPTVFERRKEIAARLRDFVADGDLELVQTGEEQAAAAADLCLKLFNAGVLPSESGIGLDAAGVALLMDALEARGLTAPLVKAVPQGWQLVNAVITLPLRLEGGRMFHAGQPIMAWSVGNARQTLRGSNYVITKEASGPAKIDPLMATLDAAMLMNLNPQPAGQSYLQGADLMVF